LENRGGEGEREGERERERDYVDGKALKLSHFEKRTCFPVQSFLAWCPYL